GRGRLGRNWESPAGLGLYFSLLLRPKLEAASAPLLTLAVGLGLAGQLRKLGIPEVMVKWPNDLLVQGRKLGGILTEMLPRGSQVDFVVVGVGINVAQTLEDFSPETAPLATSLRLATHRDWNRAELLAELLPALFLESSRLEREGSLKTRWEQESGMLGVPIAYSEDLEHKALRHGRVLGLAEDGKLRIENEDGEITELLAGDIKISSSKFKV
ncbi:MAG TPA: biotin--[acetyl-CoA-carboxylase] ligase, partial [Deltaproteobacteria bacterium]|nr:biotin--[acetyl-CoA-carboxylase] ligase [Deltaproteobacteria bacterium]